MQILSQRNSSVFRNAMQFIKFVYRNSYYENNYPWNAAYFREIRQDTKQMAFQIIYGNTTGIAKNEKIF